MAIDDDNKDTDDLFNNEASQKSIDDLFDNPSPIPETQGLSVNGGDDKDSFKINEIRDLEAVYDVPVQISAVLGKSTMPVHQLLKLGRGAVVELDRRVGEAIDIYINNRLVARGEVVVVDDHLGVTMTEIIKSERS